MHGIKTEKGFYPDGDFVMDDGDKKPNVTQMLPKRENQVLPSQTQMLPKSQNQEAKQSSHSRPSMIFRIPLKGLRMKTTEEICITNTKTEMITDMNLETIATIPNIESKTKFLCDLCDYTSDQNGHLKRHKLLKHTANFVNCNQCSASLKPNNLTRHMKEVHQEAKKLSCKECDFTTVRPQHLKEHISCKHSLVKLVCGLDLDGTFCKYSTTFEKQLEEHKLRKHLGVPRVCEECGFKASSRDILYHHVNRKHKNMQYQCMLCDKTYTKNASLKNHIKILHVKESERCHLCEKVYTGSAGLKHHIQSKHLNIRVACEYCNKDFHSRSSKLVHIKSKHLSKKSECQECRKKYNDDSALRKHKQKIHKLLSLKIEEFPNYRVQTGN